MSNLFDFSSLAMIPTAYKDGKLYSVRPVEHLGSELVTNGDFSSASDWTFSGGGVAISGGKLNFTGTTREATQSISVVNTKTYRVSYEVSNFSAGSVRAEIGSSTGIVRTANGIYSEYIVASGANTIQIDAVSFFTGSIDNVSVKEVIAANGDFTFTRGSNLSATRVDASQLIEKGRENLNIYSDPLDAQKGSTSYAAVTYQDNYNWNLGSLLNNAIVFVDNSTTRYAYYNNAVVSGTLYTLSVFMIMDDNSVPVPATDFLIVLGGASIASGYSVEDYGNNVYRVSVYGISGASNTASGILKVASNSTKGFRISGFQVEQGLVATPYIETTGTTGKAGILENTPRLDYSGGATCPSLLLEPSRTNNLSFSEYLGGTWWFKYRCSIAVNQGVSPDGTNTSSLLTSTGSGSAVVYRTGVSNGACSIFAKANNMNSSRFSIQVDGVGSASWNQDGTLATVNGGTAVDGENYGNGWFRFTYVVTSGTTFNAGLGSSAIGDSILIWGLQTEPSSSYSTSYIPTYGVSQTRAQDDCRESSATSLIGQTEGTIYWEGSIVSVSGQGANIASFNYSTGSSVSLERQSNGTIRARIWNGGAVVNIVTSGANYDGNVKIAFAYKSGDTTLYINGLQIGTSSTAFAFGSALTEFNLGAGDVYFAYPHKSEVKQALLFKTGLTNAELASLTTI